MPPRREVDDPCRLLLVDDEVNLRAVLKGLLERDGWSVDEAADGAAGLAKARERSYAAVLTDLRMPGMDGAQLLDQLRREQPETPVVMLTAHGNVATAVDAMRRGAFDFLTKPFDPHELAQVLERAAASRLSRRREVHEAKPALEALVGSSGAMARVRERIAKVAGAPTNVLILGETGTGKELVARALHELSPRAAASFVATNCAAIPETMVEAELFGHERGAFTGAVATRPGRFELADGGTLFLDEVGDMDLKVQPKVLRALEQREIQRVGAAATRKVDVRLVAATHPDLAAKVERGAFRRDLWFRLAVLTIELPPLRARKEDLPELVDHFRKKHGARLKKSVAPAGAPLLERLAAHEWPGNVRELENVIESLVVLSDRELRVSDLPLALQREGDAAPPPNVPANGAPAVGGTASAPSAAAGSSAGPLKDVVRDAVATLEREIITRTLREQSGNVTHAATALGLSRKGLQLKLKELGISRTDLSNG
ncbi:MAG: sigma-54-dependent Fis family transcriptional regulator [Planctomycetes bacterium]|nr:sigma-54-dependent Fis family transcriptional regulator [Planctomycetota bacterium]